MRTFRSGLEDALRTAYSQLFDEMSSPLQAERDDLIHWFRTSDKTSVVVGKRQASTFLALALLAGHGELPAPRANTTKKPAAAPGDTTRKAMAKKPALKQRVAPSPPTEEGDGNSGMVKDGQGVTLTVRIEVNLPPGGDADTYDAIFASIKKHLMS